MRARRYGGSAELPPVATGRHTIGDVVRERRGISADTTMRLARYFGGDARSWLNLQTAYDLREAEISNAKRIAREVAPAAA